ncbi:MAG: ATP-binding protein [Alphaproteobacteria bacterium]
MMRFIVGVVLIIYAPIAAYLGDLQPHMRTALIVLLATAWVMGIVLFVHLTFWPKRKVERRFVSIWGDALAISGFLHFGGEATALFFPAYLWITLGNGFRFGMPYMFKAMVAHNICFAIMAWFTPYWREAGHFTAGVFVANIAIPIYVAKLIRNLRQAMEDTKAASKAKTDFLSTISHELRTPLNAILGMAQLSKLTAQSSQEKNNAITTELAANRLIRMVDSILKFQRIDSGQFQFTEQSFDPLKMLNEVKAIIEPLALQKKLGFHIRFLTPVPDTLSSDADHIQTVILNLVTNAIKYTEQGGVWLEVGVNGAGRDAVLRVNIRDTGKGIAPETQSRIFDRFVRGGGHNISEESGVGLGLSVCDSLVALLGGTIGFESKPGKGSLFWAEIPVIAQDSSNLSSLEAANAAVGERVVFLSTAETLSAVAKLAASLTGMRLVDLPALQAMGSAHEAALRQVIVLDELASTGEGADAVKKALNTLPQPPIVIALSADISVGEKNFPEAAIYTDPRDMNALTDFVRTAVRWRKIISMDFLKESSQFTSPCRKLSILVADDNELNTDVMRRMLALDGHGSTVVSSGDAALNMMMQGGFDIALLDVNMPRLSGIEVTRIFRSDIGGNGVIPIVAITADASDATREMCLEAGMNDVLTKPVSLDQMREMLAAFQAGVEDGVASPPALTKPANSTPPADASSLLQEVDENQSSLDADTPKPKPEAKPTTDEPPIFAEGQIKQLLQVFGREVFEDQFLKSFKGDVLRNLDFLRQAIAKQHLQATRDALHAVKSSANTAGARRLAVKAAEYENSCLDDASAGMAEVLQQEYSEYVMRFAAFAESVCAASSDMDIASLESPNDLSENTDMRGLAAEEAQESAEPSVPAEHYVRKAN